MYSPTITSTAYSFFNHMANTLKRDSAPAKTKKKEKPILDEDNKDNEDFPGVHAPETQTSPKLDNGNNDPEVAVATSTPNKYVMAKFHTSIGVVNIMSLFDISTKELHIKMGDNATEKILDLECVIDSDIESFNKDIEYMLNHGENPEEYVKYDRERFDLYEAHILPNNYIRLVYIAWNKVDSNFRLAQGTIQQIIASPAIEEKCKFIAMPSCYNGTICW